MSAPSIAEILAARRGVPVAEVQAELAASRPGPATPAKTASAPAPKPKPKRSRSRKTDPPPPTAEELARREQARRWNEQRDTNPDGRPLEAGQTWCGRCGKTVQKYDIVINHDLGYLGCPNEHDPTWSRFPVGKGFRGVIDPTRTSVHLTEDEMCDRWDRQHFPDCAACGDPWGLHNHGGSCYLYCGCHGYVAPEGET